MHSRQNPNNSNNSDFGFSDNTTSCSNDEYYVKDFQTDWDSFDIPKGNNDSSLSSYLSFANDQGDQEMAATSAAAALQQHRWQQRPSQQRPPQ